MSVYVDSSVVLRVILGERDPLSDWRDITRPISSQLVNVECMRAIDRARIRFKLDDAQVAHQRAAVINTLRSFNFVPLNAVVMARAADPFPTLLRTLDAIHLATAVLLREDETDLAFATHDEELGIAARALGFEVLG